MIVHSIIEPYFLYLHSFGITFQGAMSETRLSCELINSNDDSYDIQKCAKWINDHCFKKVCLQFPDHMAADSTEVVLQLSKYTQAEIFILGDTTCGNCCVDEIAAQHVNADSIIHFGHACLSRTIRIPIFHVFPKKKVNQTEFFHQFEQIFEDHSRKIVLFYDVAYAHTIENVYAHLKATFNNLITSTLNCTSNVEFVDVKDGCSKNILGRSYILPEEHKIEDYDAVFLGENEKTLVTLTMTVPAQKWYFLEHADITEFKSYNTPWLKRRRYLIEKLKDSKIVGIVIATLAIEDYLEAVVSIKNILKLRNIKSYILHVGKLSPTKLANFTEIDAFIVITCPENEVFDSREFFKPILMPYEVELAFNCQRKLSTNYCLDFRQILPGGTSYKDFKTNSEFDVSLVSGTIRSNGSNNLNVDEMSALSLYSSGSVVVGKAGAQHLQERSWKGVTQTLGQDPVRLTEEGRSGLPSHYKNECELKRT